jgi:hypothetical protein
VRRRMLSLPGGEIDWLFVPTAGRLRAWDKERPRGTFTLCALPGAPVALPDFISFISQISSEAGHCSKRWNSAQQHSWEPHLPHCLRHQTLPLLARPAVSQ